MFWSICLSEVEKGVKKYVIVRSLGYYGVINALFDHYHCYKIACNDQIGGKIGREASLIKIFQIQFCALHDSRELPNVVNLDFLVKSGVKI